MKSSALKQQWTLLSSAFQDYVTMFLKKWDTADNHKAGYKNYHQRKAEEAKKDKE